MTTKTRLLINLFSHTAAVLFTLYAAVKHIDDMHVFTWCLTSAAWIGIAGYRNSSLIKVQAEFDNLLDEATIAALQIREKVRRLKHVIKPAKKE